MPVGEEQRFWLAVSQAAQPDRCRDSESCSAAGGCGCYVIKGLGPDALRLVLDWLQNPRHPRHPQPAHFVKLLASEDDPALESLCAMIAAWGCALSQRVRA